jgi:hypothetical protein
MNRDALLTLAHLLGVPFYTYVVHSHFLHGDFIQRTRLSEATHTGREWCRN